MSWHADLRLIEGYRSGVLAPAEAMSLEAHLLSCEACQRMVGWGDDRERMERNWAVIAARIGGEPSAVPGTVDGGDPVVGAAEPPSLHLGAREEVRRPRRRRRPAMVAVATFAVILCVGVAGVLVGDLLSGPEAEPSTVTTSPSMESRDEAERTPTTATAAPTTQPTTTATEATTTMGGMVWTRVPVDGVFEEACINSVVVAGPGLVAAGAENEGEAAVWVSVDGSTWERVADDRGVFGGGASTSGEDGWQGIADLAVGPLGLVAVGWDGGPGHFDGAVWMAPDGVTWQRIPDDEGVFGDEVLTGVTYGGPGLVAVGGGGAVLVSIDGRTWQRIVDDLEPGSVVHSVAAGGPGLVAGGQTCEGGSGYGFVMGCRPAIWVSADGRSWDRLPDEAIDLPKGSVYSVEAFDGGLVAVGQDESPITDKGAVWISEDGLTWEMASPVADLGSPAYPVLHVGLSGVVWDGDRLVVGGHADPRTGPPHTAYAGVWVSPDRGESWQQVGRLDAPDMRVEVNTAVAPQVVADVVVFGSRLVAVGTDGFIGQSPDDYLRPDGAVWVGTWIEE